MINLQFLCCSIYQRSGISRNVEDIVNEAKSLTDKGCKEIILLGQNVNAYHGIGKRNAQTSLAKLIQELEKIKKLDRISYTTTSQ